MNKLTATGDYRLLGPTVVASVGGADVQVLSDEQSEVELVYNREENPTNDDTNGGHGNVSLTSIAFVKDGVDVTSTVEAGTMVTGWRLSVAQVLEAWSDEPGQPGIYKVGNNTLGHLIADGGIYDTSVVVPTLVTTIYPWGYSGNCVGKRSSFDGYYVHNGSSETYGTLVEGQTSLGTVYGCRFVSGSHGYSLGMIQMAPKQANFNWANSPSGCFILCVDASDQKWKYYVSASAGAGCKVLQPGEVWSATNFRYAIKP